MGWSDMIPVYGLEELGDAARQLGFTGEATFRVKEVSGRRPARQRIATYLAEFEVPGGVSQEDESPGWGNDDLVQKKWRRDLLSITEALEGLDPEREVGVQVYLAGELAHLAGRLLAAGAEVIVMETPPIHPDVPRMWPFLSLAEEGMPVTILSPERLWLLSHHTMRTETILAEDFVAWRTPKGVFSAEPGNYSPIDPGCCGIRGFADLRSPMEYFLRGGGSADPAPFSDGVAEGPLNLFITSTLYPEVMRRGAVTFLPSFKRINPLAALDIEFATWLNNRNQILIYNESPEEKGTPDGAGRPGLPIVTVRADALLVLRVRPGRGFRKLARFQFAAPTAVMRMRGDAGVLARRAGDFHQDYFIDADPRLSPAGARAEMCMDRCLQRVDIAVSAFRFHWLSCEEAAWGRDSGGDPEIWKEDSILRVPNLDGPLTFWRRSYAASMGEELRHCNVDPSLLVALHRQQGHIKLHEMNISGQGWKLQVNP